MTEVLLVCSKDGQFKAVSAEGHAGFAVKGSDIVCAAETVLLRTVMEVLETDRNLVLKTEKSSRGTLALSVEDVKNEDALLKERLKCTADFLRQGLSSLASEYPQNVRLREILED